ncbi:class I adenylate-forming enzyme family protein [Desulfotomaculum copahuensis]|uniref:AMP-dependent synthetase n=1 Tax=Desulfotomaculum copahuensis TaxID=1838280 RepID=A0A1B7LGM2_9FIRM|nr:AMP-binding protein [Desulfotomaculum copahuensis]OAT85251.1 AMP-dependent synthetase [Desulfotomaculum copahuensis]
MNIASIIEYNAARIPEWTAVIDGDTGRLFSHSRFNALVNKLANALVHSGVKRGDRVAIYLPNSPEYLMAYFAVAKTGAVAVPFNIIYRAQEIEYIMNNSRAGMLIAAAEEYTANVLPIRNRLPYLEQVAVAGGLATGAAELADFLSGGSEDFAAVETGPEEPLTILYTSGTTGKPKGAVLTHGNFLENARLNGCHVLHINDQDLFHTGTPFCHIFFVLTVLGPLYAGAGVVTSKRFFPEQALRIISQFRVTHFAGVPTMYIYMLQACSKGSYDLKAWRFAQSAGASMPAEYIREIEETFGTAFCECYGSTETSSTVTFSRLGHGKAGSIGPPARGWEVMVADDCGNPCGVGEVGELWVKGPGVFKEYWEMPEETAASFSGRWFHTGDLGRCDQDGYYYIVDRKKDMLICGGYNIYPREVEEVLYTHPAVLEAAVLGVPDAVKGEIPGAYIMLKNGVEASAEELIRYCKEKLAPYKAPRFVQFVSDLPRGPSGKILKRILREKLGL